MGSGSVPGWGPAGLHAQYPHAPLLSGSVEALDHLGPCRGVLVHAYRIVAYTSAANPPSWSSPSTKSHVSLTARNLGIMVR